MQNELIWKQNIQQKVKKRTSVYKVTFTKTHPISMQMHPQYPQGNFITLTFASPNRYSATPSHTFETEAELDKFLSTYT
ncbi:MAG: hypothetical protein AB7V50_08535 [Vampirovibrionia bacterium]